ncbi:hypothetical protein [Phenylobacterium sp.]|uniref:hypothetical protein n=1 Tax=Phenylobacterium sp. TaxID=1871053 RepID=UPI003983DA93
MTVLTITADVLWILALAIMAGASRQAWKRTPTGVRPPLMNWRVSRAVAFWALPAAAFAASLWLLWVHRMAGPAETLLVFGVRAASASLFALLHLRWVGAAMRRLEAEGALRP